jgi:hypothetical protein
MKEFVCNYAPLRFLPYRRTGEFVNVGVVLHCPQTDYFGFRLLPLDQPERITNFFPEFDVKVLRKALRGATNELDRIRTEHRQVSGNENIPPGLAKAQVAAFCELVRRREGLLHFGDIGVLMAATPESALEELFDRFVERRFETARIVAGKVAVAEAA